MNWLNYFEHNRTHRREIPWERGIHLAAHLRAPLIRSLQRFQLGESGEGRHLRRRAAQTGDAHYAACIDLFIKEEQEHARLMAMVLRSVNAPLLKSHWSETCFIWMRHLMGLHSQLLVLLVPEMLAKRFFRALHEGLGDPVLRAVFGQILYDEEGHLAFHADYLNDRLSRLPFHQRISMLVGWRALFNLVCLAVLVDHGLLLRAVGVSPAIFWRDSALIFDEVAAAIFSPAQVLSAPKLLLDA
jgi:hypothetical protein